ncbi:MAG: hypothetical protein DME25_10405, partial [Verrucomicrobia bacterium]
MALVMTLILLSVITFMAVTFLVVSRSEKGSVTTTTDQALASQAAEAGVEEAKAQLVARVLAWTNEFDFGPMVSTNYVNMLGFITGNTDPTNVNYWWKIGSGTPLSQADLLQNVANLLYYPCAPVFVTNRLLGKYELRSWLDLNRNGLYDTNGFLPEIGTNGLPLIGPQQIVVSNFYMGDPEWVGLSERPGLRHSASNQFIARYAYIIVPESQTLDANYIHNQAGNSKANPDSYGQYYYRDQGVGTWEGNLGAFLYDLNTNRYAWGGLYSYDPLNPYNAAGNAFVDAFSLLQYRIGLNNYGNLDRVDKLFGTRGVAAFTRDWVDGYSVGRPPLINVSYPQDPDTLNNLTTRPWPGSDNPNHFFTPSDFVDPTKVYINPQAGIPARPTFVDRMLTASTNLSSYDRYTFYRMFQQLGTDSAPESGKLNPNYMNVDLNGNIVPNAATNFIPWEPVVFFTNAAVRLLMNAGYAVGIGPTNILFPNSLGLPEFHIQVYPTNFYTPSLHRLLQLAANVYDASTNRSFGAATATNGFPSVFQPVFDRNKVTKSLYIVGYQEVQAATDILQAKGHELSDTGWQPKGNDIVYGIPLVIGAKKGFPNFNEFAMQTRVWVSRLLEFRRPSLNADVNETNQLYVANISSVLGVEGWNSYSNPYPRNLEIRVAAETTAVLTNEMGTMLLTNFVPHLLPVTNYAANSWSGWTDENQARLSFRIPLDPTNNAFMFLTNSAYRPGIGFQPPIQWTAADRHTPFVVPHWWLNLNTRVRFVVIDKDANPNRIVDYVNLNHSPPPVDIMTKLAEGKDCKVDPTTDFANNPGSQWCTNRPGDSMSVSVPTYGMINQIQAGLFGAPNWAKNFTLDNTVGRDAEKAVDGFRYNLKGWSPQYPNDFGKTFYKSNVFYAPFDPYRPIYIHTTWQANDPLVHYTIGDLLPLDRPTLNTVSFNEESLGDIGGINSRYEPWGGAIASGSTPTMAEKELAAKDPVPISLSHPRGRSDDWDFPT